MNAHSNVDTRPTLMSALNAVDLAARHESSRWTTKTPPPEPSAPPMTLQTVAAELATLILELQNLAGSASALREDLGGAPTEAAPSKSLPIIPEGDGAVRALMRAVFDARAFAAIATQHVQAAANLI